MPAREKPPVPDEWVEQADFRDRRRRRALLAPGFAQQAFRRERGNRALKLVRQDWRQVRSIAQAHAFTGDDTRRPIELSVRGLAKLASPSRGNR